MEGSAFKGEQVIINQVVMHKVPVDKKIYDNVKVS
jgi:hypothetical protein